LRFGIDMSPFASDPEIWWLMEKSCDYPDENDPLQVINYRLEHVQSMIAALSNSYVSYENKALIASEITDPDTFGWNVLREKVSASRFDVSSVQEAIRKNRKNS